jgi:predicted PurR-regulated permease PerM
MDEPTAPVRILPLWLTRTVAYCVAALVVALTAWLSVKALVQITTVSFSVAAAALLAALLYPLTDVFARALPRWAAALLTVLAFVLALVASLFLVVERAIGQVSDFQDAMNKGVHQLENKLTHPPLSLSQGRVQKAHDQVMHFLTSSGPSPVAGASMLVTFLSAAVLILFVLFFLLKDGSRMWAWAVSWVPARHRERTDGAGRTGWQTLTSYVRGTVLVALIDAVGIGAAMLFLGVPLTASLTLIVFIGAFVPIVGATVSGVVAIGITLVTVGPVAAVILFAAVLVVQQVEGNVLQPLIMGRALRLHPVAIVLTVSVGTLLGGILGAIVAVPYTAVVYRVTSYLAGRE